MPVTIEKRTITPWAKTQKKRPETREEKMIAALSPDFNIMVNAVRFGDNTVTDYVLRLIRMAQPESNAKAA